jgi:hypothetical protein
MPTEVRPEMVQAPRVPDEVLEKIAKRAQVPTEEYESFFSAIRDEVEEVWRLDRRAKESTALGPSLSEARSAAFNLYEKLANLTEAERDYLQTVLGPRGLFLSIPTVADLLETADLLRAVLSHATGTVGFSYQPRKARDGRPPGIQTNPNFKEFVSRLLILAELMGKGLTLEKNTPPSGGLIDALNDLATYLPTGFVPAVLPGSTLQEIKTKCSKAARESDEMDRSRSGRSI